jgi:hypothetical protein
VTVSVDAHQHAEHARRDLGLSIETLWLAYAALGGAASLPQLDRYLTDGSGFTGIQHDYVAQALNDGYIDLGRNHEVPYSETFPGIL